MSFLDDLIRFNEATEQKIVEVKRRLAFDLFSSIIISTPVLEGTLRNNWYDKVGYGSTEVTSFAERDAETVISNMQSELNGTDIIRDTFFTNNSPYGYRIEFDGWSAKAPAGMVRINVLRWDAIVQRNAAIVGGLG